MNDHYGQIVHQDRTQTMYREAANSRLAASRQRTGRAPIFSRSGLRRLSAAVASALGALGAWLAS